MPCNVATSPQCTIAKFVDRGWARHALKQVAVSVYDSEVHLCGVVSGMETTWEVLTQRARSPRFVSVIQL